MKYELFTSALHYAVSVTLFFVLVGLAVWLVAKFVGRG